MSRGPGPEDASTASRRAEGELYQALAEQLADSVFVFDPEGRLVDMNASACELLGTTRAQMLTLSLADLVPERDRDHDLEQWRRLEAGSVARRDGTLLRRDGAPVPVEISSLRLADGRVVSVARASGASPQVEQELRRTRDLLRAIIEAAPVAIVGLDLDGNVQMAWNPAAEKMLGWSAEEVMGRPLPSVPDEGQEEFLRFRERIRHGMVLDGVAVRRQRKDGSPIEYRIYASPLFDADGRIAGNVAVLLDITEQERVRGMLVEREREYRTLLENMPDPIVRYNAKLERIYVNPAWERGAGLAAAEVIDVAATDTPRVPRPANTEYLDKIREVLDTGTPQTAEFTWTNARGELLFLQYVIAPEYDNAGNVIGVLSVGRDLTERKRLEDENAQLAAQFFQAQKMDSIGQLAGGIAHDLNNMLIPILGYTDLALSQLGPEDELHDELAAVKRAAERAADLTRQILAFSRQQVLELHVVDLNEIIEGFESILQRLIGEDIELQTWVSPALYPVKADKGQVEQVLMNLAINSRDAMPQGGKLVIETDNVFLDEAYAHAQGEEFPAGHYAMLAVSDSGEGMEPESREHIFEPFFTTKEKGKGTGLGLATVFGIVKQHQGHIAVYSEPGQGTTFRIYLPRAEAAAEERSPRPVQAPTAGGSETVLVVDDDDDVRSLVCQALQRSGYRVVSATSPAECLDLLEDLEAVDLLLTDLVMPGMNGRELAKIVVASHPGTRVLYMSGYTSNIVLHRGVLDEGVNLMQKPFVVQDLVHRVREALDADDSGAPGSQGDH